MSIRVFVSHSHEDAVLSRAVSALLSDALGLPEEQILNTSQPSTGLKAGSVVHEELRAAMNSAEVCLVLITPASGDRPWIQFEAGAAYFQSKPLYVLVHPSAEVPHTLPNRPTTINRVEEIAGLLDAIRSELKLVGIPSIARIMQAASRFVAEAKAYNPERTILHCENRLEIQIGYGDLLDWPESIALPCDNRFDLLKNAEGGQLYERTLIGQFRSRFLPHLPIDGFREHMCKRLGGSKLDDQFEVGHVSATKLVDSPSGPPDRRTLFLVVLFTVMNRSGVTEGGANPLDVWRAYENLWKAVSSSRPAAVAVPLFGSGQSGAGLSRQQSCALAVMSAVCVGLVQPIYPKVHLLCRDRESYRALDVRAIAGAAGLEHGPRSQ